MVKKLKQPWPTKAVMNQIYDMNLWGGPAFDFYSGAGSHDPEIIKPYLEVITTFLKAFNPPLSVCDLGCGDFNIGKHLISYTKNYMAIDIVDDLIKRNKQLYNKACLEFHCLDISKDKLPIGDCIIIRQVLQHLSNIEIQNIIKKFYNFKYIILNEHLPLGSFEPNKDIISGQGIRLKQNSGVNLLKAPFFLSIKSEKMLNEHFSKNNKGRIVTILYEMF